MQNSSLMRFAIILLLWNSLSYATSRGIKSWTVLVYVAGDNNLQPFISVNQKQMEQIGTNDNANLLMYVCEHLPRQTKVSRKMVVYKGKSVQVGATQNLDSGSPSTVLDACKWAIQSFPAQHYAIVFWDHGSGWRKNALDPRGVCFDDTTGHHLSVADIDTILKTVTSQYLGGKKIDLVGFDACLMANIEVAYTVAQYANYMVCSEETIPGDGWPYHLALAPFAKGTVTPAKLATTIVSAYDTFYKPQINDYTLAALDLSKLNPIVTALNQISSSLIGLLNKDKKGTVAQTISTCSTNSTHFEEQTYLDLSQFMQSMLNYLPSLSTNSTIQATIKKAINTAISSINACVISRVQGSALAQSKGISIYLPSPNDGIERAYLDLAWSQQTQWAQFLRAYLGV